MTVTTNHPALIQISPETDRHLDMMAQLHADMAKLIEVYGIYTVAAELTRQHDAMFPLSHLAVKVESAKTQRPDPGMAYGCSDCFTDVSEYEQIPTEADCF
jgi:hypothetical protein